MRQILPFRQVEEPLGCLHPGDVRIAEIAQRMAEQRGENAGIGVADDQEIAVGLLKSVTQVARLKADIGLAGNVVGAFLFAYGFHLRTPAIIQYMDLVIQRDRVGHFHGVADGEPHQLHIFGIGGDKEIDLYRPGLLGIFRPQAVVDLRRRGRLRRVLFLPQVNGEEHRADPGQRFRQHQRNGVPERVGI